MASKCFACSTLYLARIDVELRDASGIALGEIAAKQNIPVVFLSGNVNIIEALGDWGMSHLEKPFRLESLHDEAARIINDSRNRRHNIGKYF